MVTPVVHTYFMSRLPGLPTPRGPGTDSHRISGAGEVIDHRGDCSPEAGVCFKQAGTKVLESCAEQVAKHSRCTGFVTATLRRAEGGAGRELKTAEPAPTGTVRG